MNPNVSIPRKQIAAFCQKHGLRLLAIFGSALRADFRHESDIDMLVEFEPDRIPTLFDVAGMERELSNLLGGKKVDLRTPDDLSRYFRCQVMKEAELLDAAEQSQVFMRNKQSNS